MSSKQRLILFLVVFVGGALWAGLPFARALRYRDACERALYDVAARPDPERVFALAARIKALAPASGVDPAAVQVSIALRRLGYVEAPSYRLQAHVVHGSWNDTVVAHVEEEVVDQRYLEALLDGGVELLGMPEEVALAAAR